MKKSALALALTIMGGAATWAAVTLTIALGTPNVLCSGDGAIVTLDYTVSSTDASTSTVVETLKDANNLTKKTNSYTITGANLPGGWLVAGRTKSFDATFQAAGLSDGDYSLEVCVTQPGSGGNPDKKVCQTKTITVNCAAVVVNPCANTAFFGEVVGNQHISDNSTAQIQFEGDFGPTAHVEITDSDGAFVGSADISRNGSSCNYHASWKFTTGSGADIYGNHGPGVYTLTVTGNGFTKQISATLN